MILETKLTLPQPKPGALLRTGLIDLIKNNLDKKLILITAGAGYGKTTLLAQLIRDARLPVVFYDLDKGDSNLLVFYSYLINGIKQFAPESVKYSEELLKQGGEIARNIELMFGTLINELHEKHKKELFIILDNYHNMTEDSFVHRAFDFFIDHMPEKIHVVIASRSVPPLPTIARWRAKQDLFEVTRDDLAFSGEEIAELHKDAGRILLSEEDIQRLAAHTEGWITGISLILQSKSRGGKTIQQIIREQMEAGSAGGGLFEYFTNDILSNESEVMQTFLINSSILETMTPAVCDALLDTNDSGRVLKILEKRHLFISAIRKEEYKYHQLFREFLQKRLKDDIASLHLKAAEHYRRNGSIERAIGHYLEAKAYEKAGGLIYDISDEMVLKARCTELDYWLQRMPDEVFLKQPELLMVWGEANKEQCRLQEAEEKNNRALPLLYKTGNYETLALALLERANHCWIKKDYDQTLRALRRVLLFISHRRLKKRFVQQMKGNIINLKALVWTRLGAYGKAKASLLRVRRSYEIVGNSYDNNTVESNLALLYANQGEDRMACNAFHALILKIGNYYCDAGVIHVNAALAAINAGDIERAERSLEKGWKLCRPYDDPRTKAHFELGNGILCLQRAQWEPALRYLGQAALQFKVLGLDGMHCVALRDICRVYRYQGNYQYAREYYDKALAMMGEQNNQLSISLQIEQSLLLTSRADIVKAERAIKNCLTQARKFVWNRAIFMAQLAGAQIYYEQDKVKQASACFHQAVRLAKLKGYDGLLMRELRASPGLINLAKKSKVETGYLMRILSGCKISGTTLTKPSLIAHLFGRFELSENGTGREITFKRKTTKAIFSLILLHPRGSFTWEEIAAWLWPESPASTAHMMIKRDIGEIHQCSPVLKQAVICHSYRYSLNPDCRVSLDALEFQQLLNQAATSTEEEKRIEIQERAVELYRGPLLADLDYEWINNFRSNLEIRYTATLGSLVKKFYDNSQYEKTVLYCKKYIEVNEIDENIHRLLIYSLIALGHNSLAIKQYEALTEILRKNIGTSPSSETDSLIRPIR